MRTCDRAAERAENNDLRGFGDSRGLVSALAGNTQGAIEDFEFLIEHTKKAEWKSQLQGWVTAMAESGHRWARFYFQEGRIPSPQSCEASR